MHAEKTLTSLRIVAPARLHLGFLDLNGSLGRQFGSIGLAIDQPSTTITITPAPTDTTSGPDAARATRALARLKNALAVENTYGVAIESAIPAHAGLGSGTQLALAVSTGLAKFENLPHTNDELGELHARGARSAIGIGAFTQGGFIVDGGKGNSNAPPPILSRMDFPQAWRVILVLDPNAKGVHGDSETNAFDNLQPMTQNQSSEMCRRALMQMLPGIAERDITQFGAAITEIQRHVGAHFAPAQGGDIWASSAVATLIKRAGSLGAHGIGQSSWGPTGFAFVESAQVAENIYHSLVEDAKGMGLDILIARGRNEGAAIS